MRGGPTPPWCRTRLQRPRLVASHSTRPPSSPLPPAHGYTLGLAVMRTLTDWKYPTDLWGDEFATFRENRYLEGSLVQKYCPTRNPNENVLGNANVRFLLLTCPYGKHGFLSKSSSSCSSSRNGAPRPGKSPQATSETMPAVGRTSPYKNSKKKC